ncbi:hypothetical protein FHR32_001119 [Streptosporangium album]|uniref:Uncharacterized protein n=1 Tax=Streptosporangium album TaxID=47479 RepID=A0A7W7RRD6_9ACTN|nr:hypothetical protein [Streptosporangium album]MBB4936814.1 hypothetical protein [Streptosporangium album]
MIDNGTVDGGNSARVGLLTPLTVPLSIKPRHCLAPLHATVEVVVTTASSTGSHRRVPSCDGPASAGLTLFEAA